MCEGMMTMVPEHPLAWTHSEDGSHIPQRRSFDNHDNYYDEDDDEIIMMETAEVVAATNCQSSHLPRPESPPLSPSPLTRVDTGVVARGTNGWCAVATTPAVTIDHDMMTMDSSRNSNCLSPNSISRELFDTEESIRLGLIRMGKNNNNSNKKFQRRGRGGGILKRSSSSMSSVSANLVGGRPPSQAAVSSTAFLPPEYVVVSSQRHVEFCGQVLCIEVDRIDRLCRNDVWWTLREMERFRYEAARCKDRKSSSQFGIRRSSRCANHIRRVLLQQDTSEVLDGCVDEEYLANISAESSSKSRDAAYRAALRVEAEVEEDSIVSPNVMGIDLSDDMAAMCFSPRVADFYIGSFLSLCGSF